MHAKSKLRGSKHDFFFINGDYNIIILCFIPANTKTYYIFMHAKMHFL